MSTERIWDYTTIDVFQSCRRKYYWQFVRHLQTKQKSMPLLFGGAIHDALDLLYTKGLHEALKLFGETFKDREGEELRTKDNGIKLLTWYSKVYENEPFKVIGKPETGFVFPIGEHLWGGRMDLPVTWGSDLWIVEHKTTSYLKSTYFDQFEIDKQITGYIIGAEEYLGRKCQGCVINVLQPWKELKRPTAKSKKPEEHFLRKPMTRSPEQKERFKLNIQRIIRDILWCEEHGEFYEAERKDSCHTYNSRCPFQQLCQFGEDESVIKRDYIIEKWEPYKTAERKEVK